MGHNRIAGRISERNVGIQVMLQVDVPNKKEGFSRTELFSPSAIFSIKPTTEEWCRKFVAARVNYEVLPFIPPTWQLQQNLKEKEFDFEEEDDEFKI